MLKRRNRNVGSTTIAPATTPRKGYYIVDSVLACYPNWPQYAIAWLQEKEFAGWLAGYTGQEDGNDYIVINEKGLVVYADGALT